jgi:hypothetical protein
MISYIALILPLLLGWSSSEPIDSAKLANTTALRLQVITLEKSKDTHRTEERWELRQSVLTYEQEHYGRNAGKRPTSLLQTKLTPEQEEELRTWLEQNTFWVDSRIAPPLSLTPPYHVTSIRLEVSLARQPSRILSWYAPSSEIAQQPDYDKVMALKQKLEALLPH